MVVVRRAVWLPSVAPLCPFLSTTIKLLQATVPTVVLSRQYSYKTGYRSLADYPHRYAREVELCTKASRFLRVAAHSKNQ